MAVSADERDALALLAELGHGLGGALQVDDGVAILSENSGHQWVLEVVRGTQLLFIHSALNHHDQLIDLERTRLLELNYRLDLLRGSWIAINRRSGALELCAQFPVAFLDCRLLENLLVNLMEVRDKVLEHLSDQPPASLDERLDGFARWV